MPPLRPLLAAAALLSACASPTVRTSGARDMVACAPDNGGITLPEGFCASVFADSLGPTRHIAVAPNGDVFIAIRTRPNPPSAGGIVALRDANGDGRADAVVRFGSGTETGIGLRDGWLYADVRTAIVRWRIPQGALEPTGAPDTVVKELPTGGHGARNFVFDGGALIVNIGSQTNACQEQDRQKGSKGVPDCPELRTRAGLWRFDADRVGQRFADGQRWATGIRNAVALARHPQTGAIYAVSHGRDNFFQNWPELYDEEESANLPSEELLLVKQGDDFGWPFCYHDPRRGRVLAPEYGGDGETAGRCANTTPNVGFFPAHWAPIALHFYTGSLFPARYRDGAFITFHGSWNRAPRPQAGYNLVFQPMANGRAAGNHEVFADGFAGGNLQPRGATHRPAGLGEGPDGSLYVSDDARGRVWKVVYRGARTSN